MGNSSRKYQAIFFLLLIFFFSLSIARAWDGPQVRVWRGMPAAPTMNDDRAHMYRQGDIWITTDNRIYTSIDDTPGMAEWALMLTGSGVTVTGGESGTSTVALQSGSNTVKMLISGAEGLAGADFRIGLPKNVRAVHFMDEDDVHTDLGISANSQVRLYFWNSAASTNGYIDDYNLNLNNSNFNLVAGDPITLTLTNPLHNSISADESASGAMYKFSSAAGVQMTGAANNQSTALIEARVNKAGGNFSALSIDVIDKTAIPTDSYFISTTDAVAGTSPFRVGFDGIIETSGVTLSGNTIWYGTGGAAVYLKGDEMYAVDNTGTETQLTTHDAQERFVQISRNIYTDEVTLIETERMAQDAPSLDNGPYIHTDWASVQTIMGPKYNHPAPIGWHAFHKKKQKEAWMANWIKANSGISEVSWEAGTETFWDERESGFNNEVEEYEIHNGKLKKAKKTKPIMEPFENRRLKNGHKLDKDTGKVYKFIKPTKADALTAAETGFTYQEVSPPAWMVGKIDEP